MPNLREGNLPTYILILAQEIDREGIKWMTFNLYDNIWIKECFIFSNFSKNEISNIVFDILKKIKSFCAIYECLFHDFEGRSDSELLRTYSFVRAHNLDSNDKIIKPLKKVKTETELKFKFFFDQLMNKNNENPLQTYKAPKRTDELYDKIFNLFSQYFIGEGNEDNNLLSLKNNNEFPLEEKESNERKFTLDNIRLNFIGSCNGDNNISSVGSLDSLFDEIEEKKIEEHMPFITKMDNFVNEHYLNASE